MATKKASRGPNDWERTGGTDRDWENLSTGFAPLWRPEEGSSIEVTPVSVKPFAQGKKKKKTKKGVNYAIDCIFQGGDTEHFFTGSGTKQKKASVNVGDMIVVGSSHNLMGEDKLVVEEGKEARLSRMAQIAVQQNGCFRLTFNGKTPLGGGRSVNDFSLQVEKKIKEYFASGEPVVGYVSKSKQRSKK